jgi:N-acetylneuraminic acid mutarotase
MKKSTRAGNNLQRFIASVAIAAGLSLATQAYAQGTPIADAVGPGKWFKLAPMMQKQNEAATAVVDGHIYVIGGFSANSEDPITRVQVYDPSKDTWSEGVALPEAMHHAGAAVVDGRIYLVGGFHNAFSKRDPIDHVWMFDPVAKAWVAKAPLPKPRGALVVAAVNGKIYAAGGEEKRPAGRPMPQGGAPTTDPVTDLTVYDPVANSWQTLAPMKYARDHAFVGVIDGKLYVVGGRNRPKYDITALEMFDPATGKWSDRAPMPTGRSGGNASILDGRMYVFGGEGNPNNPLGVYSKTEAYDAKTDSWTKFGPMPLPRHSLSAATIGNRIILPGGAPSRGGSQVLDYVDAFAPN